MGRRQQRTRSRTLVVVALALVVGVVAFLRSRADDHPSAAEVAEKQSACASLLAFRSLLNDPAIVPSSPAVAARPERLAVLAQSVGSGAELVASAPSRIRNDVRTLVGAVRRQASAPGEMRTPAFFDARQRLSSFLDDSDNGCQPGGESGDG